jgi:hypothetical protein
MFGMEIALVDDDSEVDIWPPPLAFPEMYGLVDEYRDVNPNLSRAKNGSKTGLKPDSTRPPIRAQQTRLARVVRMSDVEAEPVDWLWTDLIARGKFGIWEGDPGVGKTFALLAVGAALTRGNGLPNMEPRDPSNVLLFTLEDDLADTIKPRLDQLGADTTRFLACEEPWVLDGRGISFLDATIREWQPALVILDPIMGFIPGQVDIYKPNHVRLVTTPLRTLARDHNTAIIAIRHLTKSQKNRSIYRGAGGMDFVGASRLVVLVGQDPDDPSKRAVVQTKTNLGNQGVAYGYAIANGSFTWTGTSTLTAERILSSATHEGNKSAIGEASDFLRAYLSEGPRPTKDVEQEATSAGIKKATLQRAKQELGIESFRRGTEGGRGSGAWLWALP